MLNVLSNSRIYAECSFKIKRKMEKERQESSKEGKGRKEGSGNEHVNNADRDHYFTMYGNANHQNVHLT